MTHLSIEVQNELLIRISQNDEKAFEIIYRYYSKKLKVVLYATCKAENIDWEDLLQEVFLKIWISRSTLASVKKFNSYAFFIARNTMLTLKSKRCRRAYVYKLYGYEHATWCNSTEETILVNNAYQIIAETMKNRLSGTPLDVFYLHQVTGLTIKQIAAIIQITTQAVGMHIVKAKKIIQESLKRDGE